MKLAQILEGYIQNPFPRSLEQRLLFHGTNSKFDKFLRPVHGIYVTPLKGWAETHYGGIVVPLWANVIKKYKPTEEEIDYFYDVNYPAVAKLLHRLSQQDYNCCMFGGESESMVLFNDIEIVHAETGRSL